MDYLWHDFVIHIDANTVIMLLKDKKVRNKAFHLHLLFIYESAMIILHLLISNIQTLHRFYQNAYHSLHQGSQSTFH